MEENTKSHPISKEEVWEAYQRVRQHGKAAGVDEVTLGSYEADKSNQLYKVWNRMASGTYHPPAVRRVEIPKVDGKKRKLGIPTVNDRVAQTVVKNHLGPQLEPHFHDNSFGYRPSRGAHQAVQQAREQSRKQDWVLDVDIEGFFDNLPHDLLMKVLRKHTTEKWVLLYVERWLKAPIEYADGRLEYPEKGSPQGGVISPLLSNLFLHYAFDQWMKLHYGEIVFERYADDIIVHCSSQQEAEKLLEQIRERLLCCGLKLHPEKTKIVYCKDSNRKSKFEKVSFDFLGFTFKPRKAQNKKTGKRFTSFGPGLSTRSGKKITETIRTMHLHRRMDCELETLATHLVARLRGWLNYFGRVNKWSLRKVMKGLNDRLVRWVSKRYKRFKGSMKRAGRWLKEVSQSYPNLFLHWAHGFTP
jgi:group II intron reverse transcriptase/maturase